MARKTARSEDPARAIAAAKRTAVAKARRKQASERAAVETSRRGPNPKRAPGSDVEQTARRRLDDERIAESDNAETHNNLSEFTRRVRAVVRAVPHGKVVSYGGVAAIVGQPRAARAVGRALCTLPDGDEVPWWRVINRNAEISIKCTDHGPALQRALLEREGVRFDRHGRTDWKKFGWDGADVPAGIREDDAGEARGVVRGRR